MTSWLGAVERTVTGMGYELVDAERSAGGLLRVTIDRPYSAAPSLPAAEGAVRVDGPVKVEDCERVTRQLQHLLEVEGVAYERLEVSSPGVDRPLKKAADYARFSGEPVEITLREPFQGRKKYRGVLQPAGAGWRLVLEDEAAGAAKKKVGRVQAGKAKAAKPAEAPGPSPMSAEPPTRALDFSLDEVRDARLVPVLDFKGRRLAEPEVEGGMAAVPDDEMDGGRIP